MKVIKCRNCKKKKFFHLFSLGNLYYTGLFKIKKANIPKDKITLVMCKSCKLVQLNKSFNPKIMYDHNYGYRTGINKTMSMHVRNVVKKLSYRTNISKGDLALDIASNDGTLLNNYPKNIITCGVDPILNKYKKFYSKVKFKVPEFFNLKYFLKKKLYNKFKIITALSVFYDLKNPNKFLSDIKELLSFDGIFYVEFADLYSIIKNNMFDTICHEHMEYYSFNVINNMVKKNHLKIIDLDINEINGGSIGVYVTHKHSKFTVNNKNINILIKLEKKSKLNLKKTFNIFFKNINSLKIRLMKTLMEIKKKGKSIHGYGASTKGNVLLQYFKIDNKIIDYISDRNPKKNNLYTPGTKIQIINESKSRNLRPDYYLVLPWHFKKEILSRERKIRLKGTKFIFPLPDITVV